MVEFKRILCPVDFFPASERSFDYAVGLASKYGSELRALHVISRIVPTVSDKPIRTSPLTEKEEKQAKRELDKIKKKAVAARVAAETEIRIGDIDIQILHTVKETAADLLVMGTHGRRGLNRWIVGSVVERMLRHSPVPLMTIGSAGKGPAPAIRRVLVTTDFSKGTSDAIAYALSIAAKYGSAVTILHVIDNPSAALGWSPSATLMAGIRKQLAATVPADTGGCEVTTRLETGTPYSTILRVIKEWKPGLVVMNTHGMGMIDRVLIGSTAERVVRGAAQTCPMLMVPPMKKRRA